jgi:hypothetical protein
MVQITLGPNVFWVYRDFITYYSPVLAGALSGGDMVTAPSVLADVDVDVFGLFVQWLYTQSLIKSKV